MNNQQKLSYISSAKIIGIFLVVFGHSYPFNVPIPHFLENLQIFVYSFHMPLFVFISAFLVTKTDSIARHGAKSYLLRRAKKLFIPYLGLSLIGIAPKLLLQNFINDEVSLRLSYFVESIFIPRNNVWGHFWFIPMIFFLAALTIPYVALLKKNYALSCALCAISFCLPFIPKITYWFGLNDIKDYLCWYLLGLLLGKSDRLESALKHNIPCIVAALISALAFFFRFFGWKSVVAIAMVFFTLSISSKINLEKIRFLKSVGQHNFTIYILSWPAQAVVEVVANRILGLPIYIVMIMMFACGIIVPLIINAIVEKIDSKIKIGLLKTIIGN